MYKKASCTCKVVVLLNKAIAFLTFSLPSTWLLLKLPNPSSATHLHSSVANIKIQENFKIYFSFN